MIKELRLRLSNSPTDTITHELAERLRTGNDIHQLALDLYYSDPKKKSAKHQALELIVYDRVDRLLAQKGVVLDYPPDPKSIHDEFERYLVMSLWEKITHVPQAVIVSALSDATVILPIGTRKVPHTYSGIYETYENNSVLVDGKKKAQTTLNITGKFGIKLISIDLTQGNRVIIEKGSRQQSEYYGKQPDLDLFGSKPLVSKDDKGIYHIKLHEILSAVVPTRLPYIIDPLNILPGTNTEGYYNLINLIRNSS